MKRLRDYDVPYESFTDDDKLDNIQKLMHKINPYTLGPDKASYIFNNYKDNSSMLDNILYNVSKVQKGVIYHVIGKMVRKIDNGIVSCIRIKKILLNNNDSIYLESIDDDSFGHYGVFKKIDSNIYFFESMFQRKSYVISPYYDKFINIIKKRFNISNVICDFPTNKENYSLQLTGGSLYVENEFINNNSNIWGVYQYIFGPDNQNHFCYIWSLIYLIFSRDDFKNFITFMINKDILPIVFIKMYIYYVILQYDNNIQKIQKFDIYPIKGYFNNFITKIISNSDKYSQVYNLDNNIFNIYDINVLDIIIDFDNYIDLHNKFMNNFYEKYSFINIVSNIKYINFQVPNVYKYIIKFF